MARIDFYVHSNGKEPYFTKNRGHTERDFEFFAMFRTTNPYYISRHLQENEANNWLRCPACMQCFHETCSHLEVYTIYYTIKLSVGQNVKTFEKISGTFSVGQNVKTFEKISETFQKFQ